MHSRYYIRFLLLLCISSLVLCSCVPSSQTSTSVESHIPVSTEILILDTMPTTVTLCYCGLVGEPMIAMAILTEAYQQLDIEVEYLMVPSARSLEMSNLGEVDGEICRIAGLEDTYSGLTMIPVPLLTQENMVFVLEDNVFSMTGWESLEPYSIAAKTGAVWSEEGTRGMNVTMVESPEQMFEMLEMGRVDVVLAPMANGMATIRSLGYTDIQALEPPIEESNMYHYLHGKHSEVLLPRITAVLQEMSDSGRIDEISEQITAEILDP